MRGNLKHKDMTVVSTKEFNAHQDMYLDMAKNDNVIIKKGNHLFIIQNYSPDDEPDMIFEPDDDFYRSISVKEFLTGVKEDIHEIYSGKR